MRGMGVENQLLPTLLGRGPVEGSGALGDCTDLATQALGSA
jgi:hypothetical protein